MKPSDMTPTPPPVVEGEVVEEVSADEAELWDAVVLLWECKMVMNNYTHIRPEATRTLAKLNYFLTDWGVAEDDAREEMLGGEEKMGRKERQEL